MKYTVTGVIKDTTENVNITITAPSLQAARDEAIDRGIEVTDVFPAETESADPSRRNPPNPDAGLTPAALLGGVACIFCLVAFLVVVESNDMPLPAWLAILCALITFQLAGLVRAVGLVHQLLILRMAGK